MRTAAALLVLSVTPNAFADVSFDVQLGPPRDRDAVRAELAAARRVQIERLRAYREAGVFPMNRVQPGMLNVFIDEAGHLCAAANLIARGGGRALVDATARDSNFIRLADVRTGPLFDWILHSGLTQEEVAFIQEPYDYIEPVIDMPSFEERKEQEKLRLQQHFVDVERRLLEDTERSLDLAIDRLLGTLPLSTSS